MAVDAIYASLTSPLEDHRPQKSLGIFFLVGRQKSDPGSDFSDAQVDSAKIIRAVLQKSSAEKMDDLVADGVLKEICHDEC